MADTTAAQAALGALVRERREGLHLSMDELAMRARVSRSTIHRIEHAHAVRPMPAKLARILTVVEITPDEVRAIEDDNDDDDYLDEILHWMGKADAVESMGRALQARPHMQPLAARPDLVVIDQTTGEVAQIQAPEALAAKLAAILEQGGYLVTQPRP